MKVLAENYKGIEFIRISRLPEEQKQLITQSLPSDQVIKILKENTSGEVSPFNADLWLDLPKAKMTSGDVSVVTAPNDSKTRAVLVLATYKPKRNIEPIMSVRRP